MHNAIPGGPLSATSSAAVPAPAAGKVLHPDLQKLLQFYQEARANPPQDMLHRPGLISNPSFFGIADLQRHLANPLLPPSMVDLAFQGKKVPLDPACKFKFVQQKKLFFMDKRFIDDYLSRGASVLLEGLDLLDPGINAFAAALDAGFPCALINAEAFFSQHANEVYGGHLDTDDVLVIQLSGEKKWRVYERQRPRMVDLVDLNPAQMGRQIAEFVMRAGDALYLRSGVPHKCETPGSHSLHISIDLCDRIPNINQTLEAGLARYRQDCAPPYTPAADVAKGFAALLQSEGFQAEMAQRTEAMRREAQAFRESIGNASRQDYLHRFLK
jgi:hypothetical protein